MKLKNSNKKIVIIIASLLAILAVAGVIVYLAVQNGKKAKAEAEALYSARLEEELAAMVTARFGGVELYPNEGDFKVNDLIEGRTTTLSVKPSENKPFEVTELSSGFSFSRTPKSVGIRIAHEGETVFDGALADFKSGFTPSDDGVYSFTVTAVTENSAYSGTAVYNFDISYKITPRFFLSAETVDQGSALVVYGENLLEDMPVSVSVAFSYSPSVIRRGTKMYSIIPFNYKREAGEAAVTVTYGEGETVQLNYTVAAIEFPADYEEQEITVSDETAAATINNSAAYTEYNKLVAELAKISDEEVYWTGRFIQPCDGTVTSDYAYTRYLNGKAGSTHAGVDLACDEGTPVCASNSGRVIYSGELQMSGNTVIIEHGNGLQTKYLHMSARNVETGEMVVQGQQIGAVGMTGLATGPHLHFEVDVSGACISPWPLLDGTSPIYKIQDFQ